VLYLILVSIIWSASFALFKSQLASLDADLTALLRLLLALVIFLPFFRPARIPTRTRLWFALIGGIQYGLMYMMLNESYQFLNGWQVALMTLFTPIYIVLIDSCWRRRLDTVFLLASIFAVAGAAIIMTQEHAMLAGSWKGCLLVQGADICFALGLLMYREHKLKIPEISDSELYALPYAGAVAVAAIGTVISGGFAQVASIDADQWMTLLYLGTVSSGLCFFWWNKGATMVSPGMLAALSNIKIPMAVLVGLVVFKEESGDLTRLIVGSATMIVAIALAQERAKETV
jgi:drug/metabolite transporter (DMT)-like permease